MNCLNGNVLNFSHTSRIHFSITNTLKNAIKTNGQEKLQSLTFPLGDVDPSNTPIPGQTPLTTQTAAQSLHAL